MKNNYNSKSIDIVFVHYTFLNNKYIYYATYVRDLIFILFQHKNLLKFYY